MEDDLESFHLDNSSSENSSNLEYYQYYEAPSPPPPPQRPAGLIEEEEPREKYFLKYFRPVKGKPCRNAIIYCCQFFGVVVGFILSVILAISIAVVLFTAWFPKYIHLLPKLPRAPEPTNPPGILSPWDVPLDEKCGSIRMAMKVTDCDRQARECREGVRWYEERGIWEQDEDVFWNVTKKCFNAAECLQFLACVEADRELKTFARVPHEFFMTNGPFPKCMLKFIRSLKNETADNCTADYDYLSTSYQIRNRAYIDGKDCFLNFVWENCHESVFDYLVISYNAFINLATIPMDGCGTYQKIEALECSELKDRFRASVGNVTLADGTTEEFERIAGECDEMEYCYSQLFDPCIADNIFLQQTKTYCTKMHFLKSPLIQCLQRLKKSHYKPNLRKYPCFIGHDFNQVATECIRFRDSTKCVKRIMVDYCGEEVLDGFDDANGYLLEMWDC